jgi:hypothetical protein
MVIAFPTMAWNMTKLFLKTKFRQKSNLGNIIGVLLGLQMYEESNLLNKSLKFWSCSIKLSSMLILSSFAHCYGIE